MNFKFVPFFPSHVTSYFGSGLAPCGVGLPALLHAQDTLPAKCGGDRRWVLALCAIVIGNGS